MSQKLKNIASGIEKNYDLMLCDILFPAGVYSFIKGKGLSKFMDNLTDEELVRRCKRELPYITYSFEILVDRYKNMIFSKAFGMLRHPQDAEDVVQDIFIRVFHALPKFEFRSTFRTWLTTIATNTCLTYIERRKNRRWWWLTEDIDEIKETQYGDEELFLRISEGLEREDLRRQIEDVIGCLSDHSKEMIRLRFQNEMDYKSIAEKLDLNMSTVKMRIRCAREEFKEQYAKLIRE